MLLAVQNSVFIRGIVKAVSGYAVKAYWGEEVQLHMLTSALDGGE